MKYLLAALLLAISLTGCATIKEDIKSGQALTNTKTAASAALGVAAMAQPQYASTIAQIQRLLAAPSKASAVDGFTFSRTYRYRGAICEAKEITWEDAWTRLGSADKGVPPPIVTSNSAATSTASDNVNLRADIAKILAAAGVEE